MPEHIEPYNRLGRTSMFEMHLTPIGVVRSPFREAAGTPIQAALAGDNEASVELLEEFVPGLKDLGGFERIWLFYWFDRVEWRGE